MGIINNFPGGNTDLSGVTATASDVRIGKAFVNANGEVINGTKATKTSNNISFVSQSGTKSVRVESGIYDSDYYKTIPNSYEYVSKLLSPNDFEIYAYGAGSALKLYLPTGISQFSSNSIINVTLNGNYAVSGGVKIHEFSINTYSTINGLKYHAINGQWFENNRGAKDYFYVDIMKDRNPTISNQNIIFIIPESAGMDYENFTLQDGWLTVFNPIIGNS